jgi:hypothetical protein
MAVKRAMRAICVSLQLVKAVTGRFFVAGFADTSSDIKRQRGTGNVFSMRDIRGLVESLARTNFLFWQGTNLYRVFGTSGGMRLEKFALASKRDMRFQCFGDKGRQDGMVNATLSHPLL